MPTLAWKGEILSLILIGELRLKPELRITYLDGIGSDKYSERIIEHSLKPELLVFNLTFGRWGEKGEIHGVTLVGELRRKPELRALCI